MQKINAPCTTVQEAAKPRFHSHLSLSGADLLTDALSPPCCHPGFQPATQALCGAEKGYSFRSTQYLLPRYFTIITGGLSRETPAVPELYGHLYNFIIRKKINIIFKY